MEHNTCTWAIPLFNYTPLRWYRAYVPRGGGWNKIEACSEGIYKSVPGGGGGGGGGRDIRYNISVSSSGTFIYCPTFAIIVVK